MHLRFSLSILLLGTSLLSTLSLAGEAPKPEKSDPLRWLTSHQEEVLAARVPPPPVFNSPADQADVAAVVAAQKARTPASEAECRLDRKLTVLLFQPIYGENYTPENSPRFYALLGNIFAVTHVVDDTAKNKYYRWRPFQDHPDAVHALFDVDGYSYPSGHSMASYTLATVLGAIFPGKKEAFLNRARQIAQSRVDAGVHYPSDIAEGEVVGKATGAVILAAPAFQTDLAAVKAELEQIKK
jgi:acid phosphatase (class A)